MMNSVKQLLITFFWFDIALPVHLRAIRPVQGSILFDFGNIGTVDYSLNIFDLHGKCIERDIRISEQTTVSGIGSGMFIYRVISNNRTTTTGSFIYQY